VRYLSTPKVFGVVRFRKELGDFLWKKDYRSDEPVSRYGGGQIIEWSDFVGPVAGFDANFEAPARESHRF
jgi:hypothetical protein